MLTIYHIRLIIEECREIAWTGPNGVNASIPDLEIDVLSPPNDFLGVKGNPAIFVNDKTFRLLGHLHRDWALNKTIALKIDFLQQSPIDIIGAIVHETGHAFAVAAHIENTETNAYIYEIEVLRKLLETNSDLLFGSTYSDLQRYFSKRMPFYKMGAAQNTSLSKLIDEINVQFELNHLSPIRTENKPVRCTFFLDPAVKQRDVDGGRNKPEGRHSEPLRGA